MEFMTATILSGLLYDMLKHGISITATTIKEKLKDWIIDDSSATTFSDELVSLNLNDELSESAIEKRINQSPKILALLSSLKKDSNVTTIIQNHSGTGDNIGRDKILK
ncbi:MULTISPECIES: GapS6a family protein [Aeromonas]|uniref:GapS6a family protein n=1 Tax=Aeromonas TaxID=642 RepID=UPI00111B0E35|nr:MULTISPECIES: hypothetical protein [Aeromonas]NJI18465.1 hypothetical protein [Aeromonas veronii]QHB83933.1 hypothetical protein GIS01_18210 [Aeromonas veronii]